MPKVPRELKNTPASDPLAFSSVSSGLNREDNHNNEAIMTLSAQGKVLLGNNSKNSEEDQPTKAEALRLKSEILWSRCKPYTPIPLPIKIGDLLGGN